MKKYLVTILIILIGGIFADSRGQENTPATDSGGRIALPQKPPKNEKAEKPGKIKKEKEQVPPPTLRYTILSKQTGLALSIHHGLKRDGETLLIWPDSMTDSQRWEIRPVEKQHIQLVAKHSGKPIGIKDSNKDDGAKVVQLADTGTREQIWKLEMDLDGYARFRNQLTKKYLTIEGRSRGAHLIQKKKLDTDGQKFRLVAIEFE